MPLDDDVRRLLDQLTDAPALSDGTVEDARRNYDAAPRPAGDAVARVEDRTVPGAHDAVPVRLYATTDAPDLPVVAFFHGGGWVLSGVDGHDHVARRIATLSGALVVSVGYRLAPEHPFPAAHDDCWAVTSWLAAHAGDWGGDPTRIAVCGDSAGGNLAAGVALRARDEDLRLVLQALIYPCIDDDQGTYPSMQENATGYFLTAADMRWFWDQFVPPAHRTDGRAVPGRADNLSNVAPAFVQTAEFDPLRDEGERYAERLEQSGVRTQVVRYPGVVHGFVARWSLMGRAHAALDDLADALRDAFS
jgi:acetyl esterase